LVVSSGRKSKVDRRLASESLHRKEVALVEFGAVRGKRIDLIVGVTTAHETGIASRAE
jgi:hypothetical protein